VKPFIQDGHTLALRAVRTLIGDKASLVVEAITTTDWASATFVGKHHHCELRIEGLRGKVSTAIDRLTRSLSEVEVSASGYFLADCALVTFDVSLEGEGVATIVVEALTIEE